MSMKGWIVVLAVIGCWSCEPDPPRDIATPSFGERKVFMALTPGQGDTDLSPALREALATGFDGPGDLNLDWGVLEPTLGTYTDPGGIIAWSQRTLQGIPLHLTLAPIQTTYVSVPAPLQGLGWNDTAMVNAYANTLLYLKAQLQGVAIQSVSVGNEVDVVLKTDPEQWKAYTEFFKSVYTVAKELWPEADVGVKMTYEAVLASQPGVATPVLAASDAILTTYYPTVDEFESDKNLVFKDFSSVVHAFPDKKVHFLEVGFPSDPAIHSSEALQSDFVNQVFANWDTYPDRVKSITFVWLHDLSPETLEALAASYGSNHREFISFLGSLGYLSFDKKEKESYELLVQNIQQRK